jgi:secreted Zn-dependent insulinase-like peptidase
MTFSGFSHKLQTLVHRVLESLIQLSIQEKLFALCKERAIQVPA